VKHVRDYELVYILNPDLTEEGVNDLMTRFQTLANNQGAEIQSQERWEKRRLAYEINRKREGIYVVMELRAMPSAIMEMERILRITEDVLRHMVVRAEEVRAKGQKAVDPSLQETAPPTEVAAPTAEATAEADAGASAEAATVDTTETVDTVAEETPVADEEETPTVPAVTEETAV